MADLTVASRGETRGNTTMDRCQRLLERAGITLNGPHPWDMQLRNPRTLSRVLAQGSLGLGESYMDGWWDCEQLDEFMARLLRAQLDAQVRNAGWLWAHLQARCLNLQSSLRAWQVGRAHYDLGNDLFCSMLDGSMAYSCGYWAQAKDLAQAQEDKLDLICRKLQLQPGMRLLDIGCGWGSLMRHAAEHYQAQCVGITVSKEQARWINEQLSGLPVRVELSDYRGFNLRGGQQFDRIASVGMFEHVGHQNYPHYFDMVQRSLAPGGLFLLHTIGKNHSGVDVDPWIDKYIFPNGALPSARELAQACEPGFVVEDWHNFGADYDRTLMAWHQRFEAAWPHLQARYGPRFYRMWRYYLLACAGSFRARSNQLWQLVLSPGGRAGGYRRP